MTASSQRGPHIHAHVRGPHTYEGICNLSPLPRPATHSASFLACSSSRTSVTSGPITCSSKQGIRQCMQCRSSVNIITERHAVPLTMSSTYRPCQELVCLPRVPTLCAGEPCASIISASLAVAAIHGGPSCVMRARAHRPPKPAALIDYRLGGLLPDRTGARKSAALSSSCGFPR